MISMRYILIQTAIREFLAPCRPTDRPHVFKLYGSKQFSFGTDIGIYFRASSGTPVSTQVWTDHNIPQLAFGRGDKGRTPTFSQTDLMIAHEIKTGENQKLRFEFNFDNLFNQKTAMFVYDRFNREEYARSGGGVDLSGVDLLQGYNVDAAIAATSMGVNAEDPRYGMETMFNAGFSGRFMVKFIF